MKKSILITISIVLLIVSLSLFLYPTISEMINNYYAKGTVEQYSKQVQTLSEDEKAKLMLSAQKYNENLSNSISDSFSEDSYITDEEYEKVLKVTDDGLIGNIQIPSIQCNLPIYHGMDKDNLKKGAVHMPNTSFPIGGESTHSVISAHTAYPGKELFNRLTELSIGDTFNITVLGETLSYKVIDINVVEPGDTSLLEIVKGEDLCTLVTCTPYSVNTHRLLVRGERILADPEEKQTNNESLNEKGKNNPLLPIIFIVLLLITIPSLCSFNYIRHKRRKHEE